MDCNEISCVCVCVCLLYELTCDFNKICCCLCAIRYDEIESKMIPFLKQSGYNVKKGICLLFIENVLELYFAC